MGDRHGGVLIGFDPERTGTEQGESRTVAAAVVEGPGTPVPQARARTRAA